MSKNAWYVAAFLLLLVLAVLGAGALQHLRIASPNKHHNEQVARQIIASLTIYQGQARDLGKRRVVSLEYLEAGHYLSMSTENDPVGYILDGREHYFKDFKQGHYACALFFRATTSDMRLPVQPVDVEGLVGFSGYLAQGLRNSGLGGCRFIQYEQGDATGQEVYYSSNDGTVYAHENTP